ncbi:MAG: ParB/RepB/Spo0J family partition protein, partial [Sphingobacteriales bacterium]
MSDKNQPAKKKPAMGRGLNALLEGNNTYQERTPSVAAAVANNMDEIPVSAIEVNPFQPRTHFDQEALKELSESIKVQGIIQPITVRQLSEGSYQLISGERRLQASKLAGLEKVPAYVRKANDQQMLEMALIENIQRENLNAIEIALSYQRLISEIGLKQEELGDRVGKNRSTVTNYLRLLKLPPDIQIALRDNQISMGHARALINLEGVDKQLAVFRKIVEEQLSVRKVEELVRNLATGKKEEKEEKPVSRSQPDPDMMRVQNRLSTHFGTKIQIRNTE